MPRFTALLAAEQGEIDAELTFSRDEEKQPVIEVCYQAKVLVECQRCLQAMPLELAGENTLGIVWTDDQARHLPRHLDPLIVPEEGANLWELLEDELILALPSFNYHDTEDCKQILSDYTGPAPDEGEGDNKPNPFDILAQLKTDK
ncbi:YceD family protein [Seongchinamella sediminis]|uniref:YceD family protein n=1 Tax=Seongchinamella sediminis TaxID=2283635 RepID=UPI0013C318CF|nr:YceD family protein [Seongchinamella sediminis]